MLEHWRMWCLREKKFHLLKVSTLIFAGVLAVVAMRGEGRRNEDGKGGEADPGKETFESACAVCHGLDGGGGEHAPSIGKGARARTLKDADLMRIIHDGIASKGMPSFQAFGDKKISEIVTHLRNLQGKTAAQVEAGNAVQGQKVFFGKGGCSGCHAIGGQGSYSAEDLTDYGYEHEAGEIREAIVHPAGRSGTAPEAVQITMGDGRQLAGLVRNEDNASLQVQDAKGQFYLLTKAELRSVDRKTGPAMPRDYGEKLSQAEIADLVAYIAQQTTVPSVVKEKKEKHGPIDVDY